MADNLFNKLQIKGEIAFINELKYSRSNNGYISGIIKSYSENGETKFNMFNISFIAFDDEKTNNLQATKIANYKLKKGDVLILNGSMKENFYNEKKEYQLVVASSVYEKELEVTKAPIAKQRDNDYKYDDTPSIDDFKFDDDNLPF